MRYVILLCKEPSILHSYRALRDTSNQESSLDILPLEATYQTNERLAFDYKVDIGNKNKKNGTATSTKVDPVHVSCKTTCSPNIKV